MSLSVTAGIRRFLADALTTQQQEFLCRRFLADTPSTRQSRKVASFAFNASTLTKCYFVKHLSSPAFWPPELTFSAIIDDIGALWPGIAFCWLGGFRLDLLMADNYSFYTVKQVLCR